MVRDLSGRGIKAQSNPDRSTRIEAKVVDGKYAVFELEGEITTRMLNNFRSYIDDHWPKDPAVVGVWLDFAKVKTVDSGATSFVLGVQRKALSQGWHTVLIGAQREVLFTLQTGGVGKMVSMADDYSSAKQKMEQQIAEKEHKETQKMSWWSPLFKK